MLLIILLLKIRLAQFIIYEKCKLNGMPFIRKITRVRKKRMQVRTITNSSSLNLIVDRKQKVLNIIRVYYIDYTCDNILNKTHICYIYIYIYRNED